TAPPGTQAGDPHDRLPVGPVRKTASYSCHATRQVGAGYESPRGGNVVGRELTASSRGQSTFVPAAGVLGPDPDLDTSTAVDPGRLGGRFRFRRLLVSPLAVRVAAAGRARTHRCRVHRRPACGSSCRIGRTAGR